MSDPVISESTDALPVTSRVGMLQMVLISALSALAVGASSLPRATTDESAGPPEKSDSAAASQTEESQPAERDYIRIRRNDRKLAVALETSVITFGESEKYPGATVDLIGAIHLGEPEYYDQLNDLFRKYDVLLYEAVMPEEALEQGLRPGGAAGSQRKALSDEDEWTDAKVGFTAISVLQLGMKEALGMEFQLHGVDYTPDNFVHADMTAEEFEYTMKRRGESFSSMFINEMGKSIVSQQQQNPIAMNLDMMFSAISSDRFYRVRRILAVQLAKAGGGDAFAAADGASTIITERNKKCLDVMHLQLKDGRTKVGIFYGAGHFKDMEQRLVDEYGFQRSAEDWLVAWNLRNPETEAETARKAAEKANP
jgi:hypothetical protein